MDKQRAKLWRNDSPQHLGIQKGLEDLGFEVEAIQSRCDTDSPSLSLQNGTFLTGYAHICSIYGIRP